jgi:hypothetical protein
MKTLFFLALSLSVVSVSAKASSEIQEISTNEVSVKKPPSWLKRNRMEKVIHRIQTRLEWSTRKVPMDFYSSAAEFERVHGLGAQALAVTKIENGKASIHMGPLVNDGNFDAVFGHELVHVISFQKYKGAIPPWLEEGLANHLSHTEKVNYKWLSKQPPIEDVHQLAHPFSGSAATINYRYKASQAFAEMLDKKCDLQNLIRLSVGRKMENYMHTYCGIDDLNQAFKAWVAERAKKS